MSKPSGGHNIGCLNFGAVHIKAYYGSFARYSYGFDSRTVHVDASLFSKTPGCGLGVLGAKPRYPKLS